MDLVTNQEYYANISRQRNVTKLPRLEALGEPYQTALTTLYTLTAIIAFCANIFALLVLLVGKRTSPELRKYLANLAIVDLFLAIFSIPFSYTDFMFGRWVLPGWLCPFMQFTTICAVFVSIYTLIAIGLGRYIYLCNYIYTIIYSKIRVIYVILYKPIFIFIYPLN